MNNLLKVDFIIDVFSNNKPLITKFLEFKPSVNDNIVINNTFYVIISLHIIDSNYIICQLKETNSYGKESIQHYLGL